MPEKMIHFIGFLEFQYLQEFHPNAFILLAIIFEKVRTKSGHPDGLQIGQCHLGDYVSYGLTQGQYRHAKKILSLRKHIQIIETNRTRKKSTDGNTTRGTLIKLCNSKWYEEITESYV